MVTVTDDRFEEVVANCRRSQYHELADVLEYYADHDTNQFGAVYHPVSAPQQDAVDPYHILWAFRAGRALGPEKSEQ